MQLDGVRIAANTARGLTNHGTLTLKNGTISGNYRYLGLSGGGGGVYNAGTITLANVTLSDNSSWKGAGLWNIGMATLVNVTVYNNYSEEGSGGLYSPEGSLTLHNVLATGNEVYTGVYRRGSDLVGTCEPGSSHNLIGVADAGLGAASTGLVHGVDGNLVGTREGPLDGRLQELHGNDAYGPTHGLQAHSWAIDGGSNERALEAGLSADQRGMGWFDGDGDGVVTVDIGAFEAQAALARPAEFVVTSLADGGPEDGGMTLREALAAAKAIPARPARDVDGGSFRAHLIRFDLPALQAQASPGQPLVVRLSEGSLVLASPVRILGPGADVLTIDAGGADAALTIRPGVTAALSGLTVTGSRYQGIHTYGSLFLADMAIVGNANTGVRCDKWGAGGAELLRLAMVNTLVADNADGVDLYHGYDATLANVTISGNRTGGLYGWASRARLYNSIVALNGSSDVSLSFDGARNLVGFDPGFVDPANGDYRLTAGSLAVNRGDNAQALDNQGAPLSADLAGEARIVGARVDLGAFEFAGEPDPGLEAPSTGVTTLADVFDPTDGLTSLREAILYAGWGEGEPTVTFAPELAGGRVVLNGQALLIVGSVTLEAPVGGLTLDADQRSPAVQTVGSESHISLQGLTITGGHGGGLYNLDADLTLADVIITGNEASTGGGLFSRGGSLTLTDVVVRDNRAETRGGGLYVYGGAAALTGVWVIGNGAGMSGGGIAVSGAEMTLSEVIIRENWVEPTEALVDAAWGGGLDSVDSVLTLADVHILRNAVFASTASSHATELDGGGGLRVRNGSLTMTGGTVYENLVLLVDERREPGDIRCYGGGGGLYNSGGAVALTDVRIVGNSVIFDGFAHADGGGGGLFNTSGGVLTLTGGTVSRNLALGGGGISGGGSYNDARSDLSLEGTRVDGNVALGHGGGVYDGGGQLRLTDVLLVANRAALGGGLYLGPTPVDLVDDPDAWPGDHADSGQALEPYWGLQVLLSNWGRGGGISFWSGVTDYSTDVDDSYTPSSVLRNVTISGNAATDSGGGLHNAQGRLELLNATIIGNTARGGSGGGLYNTGELSASQVTVSRNRAGREAGGVFSWGQTMTLHNSIVALNQAAAGLDDLVGTSEGGHNLVGIDPGFADRLRGDYRLAPASVAIDGGDSALAVDAAGEPLAGDRAGEPRLVGQAVDIGAFEFQGIPQANGGDVIVSAGLPSEAVGGQSGDAALAPPGSIQRAADVEGTQATVLGLVGQPLFEGLLFPIGAASGPALRAVGLDCLADTPAIRLAAPVDDAGLGLAPRPRAGSSAADAGGGPDASALDRALGDSDGLVLPDLGAGQWQELQ